LKNIKLIFLFVATSVIAFLAYAFITHSWLFDSHFQLYAELEDARGVSTESMVTVNGYEIGQVTALEVVDNKVLVELSINNEIKVPTTAQFYLVRESFLDSSQSISVDYKKNASEIFADGDTIRTKFQHKNPTETLDTAVKELSIEIGTALVEFGNKVLPDSLVLDTIGSR